jgi:YHS domain-containing protein
VSEITITCVFCGNHRTIERKEHTRQLAKGRQHFFCSRSCSSKFGNKQRWSEKNASSPQEESITPDTDSKWMDDIKQITLTKDDTGQDMPDSWVWEQIISLYPRLAKHPIPIKEIAKKRALWSTQEVT